MLKETASSLSNRARNSIEYRTGMHIKRHRFPTSEAELRSSDLYNQWWYYSVELLPGVITRGIYPPTLPMLPRMMLRKCELEGMSCLDIGTMEGLMPVLMARDGAKKILAVDAVNHCRDKLDAVQHYYDVNFEYRKVGLMYGLAKKLPSRGFDLINCSGLLYHVFSPLLVLAGLRALLKRNGLMIVSTGVVTDEGYRMEFNNAGRIQEEPNTFWYLSVQLFDYLLRYLKLAPIDCLFVPHTAIQTHVRHVFDRPSGYLSVLCRAVDEALPGPEDQWMSESIRYSWEHEGLTDWKRAERQLMSEIKYRGGTDKRFFRSEIDSIDLWEAIKRGEHLGDVNNQANTHFLKLSDRT